MSDVTKAVLITDCSTGIGRATAGRLAAGGWKVYATARRPKSIADLAAKGCETLALDVTDEASMEAAVKHVEDAEGAVGVLVNNAGYCSKRPKARYPVTASARILLAQRALLPDRGWDMFVATQFPRPGKD